MRRRLSPAATEPLPRFFREFEVLVGDPLGGVVHEPNLDPRVRCRDIRVMPCRLGEMTDGVDRHQRALPTMSLIFPTNPTAFVTPMRKIAPQSCGDFFLRIRSLGRFFGHSTTPRAFPSATRTLPALAKVLGRKHYKLELGFGKRISEPTGREARRGRDELSAYNCAGRRGG